MTEWWQTAHMDSLWGAHTLAKHNPRFVETADVVWRLRQDVALSSLLLVRTCMSTPRQHLQQRGCRKIVNQRGMFWNEWCGSVCHCWATVMNGEVQHFVNWFRWCRRMERTSSALATLQQQVDIEVGTIVKKQLEKAGGKSEWWSHRPSGPWCQLACVSGGARSHSSTLEEETLLPSKVLPDYKVCSSVA